MMPVLDSIDDTRRNFCHPDHMIRQAAAESAYALSEQLLEHDYGSLWNMLHHDVYQTVRIAAAEALCLLKRDNQYGIARNTVLRLLSYPGIGQPHQSGAEFVRARAIEALIIMRDNHPDILVALAHAIRDEFEFVRERAREALVRLSNFQDAHKNQKYYKSKCSLPPKIQIFPPSRDERGQSRYYHENLVASLKISHGDFSDRFDHHIRADDTSYDGVRTLTLRVAGADFIKAYTDRIVAHARRRIDLFFYTLVFFYGKIQERDEAIIAAAPPITHGIGAVQKTPLETDAAHDALIPSFRIRCADGEYNPLESSHFQETLNMTTELPAAVNKFDTHFIEGHYDNPTKMRAQALHIINLVGIGLLTPVDGLEVFLTKFHGHFEKNKGSYLSEKTDLNEESRKIIFYSQKEGSFGDPEDPKNLKHSKTVIWKPGQDGGILLDYLYLLLRINPAHKAQLNSLGDPEVIIHSGLFKSYLLHMQKEIADGTPVTKKEPSRSSISRTVSCSQLGFSSPKTPMSSANLEASSTTLIDKDISENELIEKAIAVLIEFNLIENGKITPQTKTPGVNEKIKKISELAIRLADSPFKARCVELYYRKSSQSIRKLMTSNISDLKKAYFQSPATQQRLSPIPFPELSALASPMPLSIRPTGEKRIFMSIFSVATIETANPWGANNCLIDALLQLIGIQIASERQKECARIRQELIRTNQTNDTITSDNEILLSFAIRILEIRGLVNFVEYLVIGHWTFNGAIQLPEICGNGHIELHLWNTGNHFEPIFNVPPNWKDIPRYQELFSNPTA